MSLCGALLNVGAGNALGGSAPELAAWRMAGSMMVVVVVCVKGEKEIGFNCDAPLVFNFSVS